MARYILIDNYSGYIWGDSADFNGKIFAGTALEFAKALDESIGGEGRTYREQSGPYASNQTGYHVYRADIDGSDAFMIVHDGQNQETIDSVTESCCYEGFIASFWIAA